jgi:hypothetical protein
LTLPKYVEYYIRMPEKRHASLRLYGIDHYGLLTSTQQDQYKKLFTSTNPTILTVEDPGNTQLSRDEQRDYARRFFIRTRRNVLSKSEQQKKTYGLDTLHRLLLLPRRRGNEIHLAFVDLPYEHPLYQQYSQVNQKIDQIQDTLLQGNIKTEADFSRIFPDWTTTATRFIDLNTQRNRYIADQLANLSEKETPQTNIIAQFGRSHLIPLQQMLKERGVDATLEFEPGGHITFFEQFMLGMEHHQSSEPEAGNLVAARALLCLVFDYFNMDLQSAFLKLEKGKVDAETDPPNLKENYMKKTKETTNALSLLSFDEIKALIINAKKLTPKRYREKLHSRMKELMSEFSEGDA